MRTVPAILALVIVSCGAPAASPAASAASATGRETASAAPPSATASGTRYGVAGLIPPHFAAPKAADHEAMYASFAATGGAAGVYTNWYDTVEKSGEVPAVLPAAFAASSRYGFGPVVVALGVARDAGGKVASTVNWSSGERDRFVAAATALARAHKPRFLALGVESNRLWTSDPAAFDGFVKGYADAYDAIKKVSPDTKVFTIFQLELLRGGAFLITGSRSSAPQWDLVERFSGRLDLVGLTTYPFLQYASPADIPADYYASVAQRLGTQVAFTEIGWPSRRPAALPAAYEASDDAQVAFIGRFFTLAAPARPALALWSFPYERGADADLFDSIALRTKDGVAKPALAAWQAGIR